MSGAAQARQPSIPQQMNPEMMFEMIAGLQQQVMAMTAVIQALEEQAKMFTLHLGKMYEAKTIEETLNIMSELGKETLRSDECTVYSVEADRLFSVNGNMDRQYTAVYQNDSLIRQAMQEGKLIIDNDFSGRGLGDGKENAGIKNVMVAPIKDQMGDVISVVVAKNKSGGEGVFNTQDAELFDLQNGKLGTAFRIGLENKALLQMATTDELTQLSNREGMNRLLETAVLDHASKREPVTAILFDIDHFKRFNDTYGHDVGDKCLRQVADTLRNNIRLTSDSGVFRWGGEEMVVILPVSEAKAFEIAERLRHAIEETTLVVNEETKETTQITVSAGIASFVPENPYDLNRNNIREQFDKRCFEKADKALYQAKETGRNRTCGSPELMRTHYSAPSPTVLLENFLKSIDLSVEKNADGYLLRDDRNGEVLHRDMQSAQELVSYLESSEIIADNLLYDLQRTWDNFSIGYGLEPDGEESEPENLREWADFLKEPIVQQECYGEVFTDIYKDDIATVFAFADKTAEIRLDRIAKEISEPIKEQQAEQKAKKSPQMELGE